MGNGFTTISHPKHTQPPYTENLYTKPVLQLKTPDKHKTSLKNRAAVIYSNKENKKVKAKNNLNNQFLIEFKEGN